MAHPASVDLPSPERAAEPLGQVQPGTLLAGRYAIQSRIGEGGMGFVYRAWHRDLDIPVAIKLVRPELSRDTEMLARFLDEARSMASIRSESIVGVYDVARLPDGTPYLVLELIDGPDLEQFLLLHRSLSTADAIAFALDVCAGLKVAHASGIIHRDIKPENLLVETKDDSGVHLKISDFGIAKRVALERNRSSRTSMETVGSPLYMAPEQMQNAKDIDGRADIWSLGVLLFEMLTGEMPFFGTSPEEVASQVFSGQVPSARAHRSSIPAELDRIIARCLERHPRDRYRNVTELAADLRRVVVPFGFESRRVGDEDVEILVEDTTDRADALQSHTRLRRIATPRPEPEPDFEPTQSPDSEIRQRPALRLEVTAGAPVALPKRGGTGRRVVRFLAGTAVAAAVLAWPTRDLWWIHGATPAPAAPVTPVSAPAVEASEPAVDVVPTPNHEVAALAPAEVVDADAAEVVEIGTPDAPIAAASRTRRAGSGATGADLASGQFVEVTADVVRPSEAAFAMPGPSHDTVVPESAVWPSATDAPAVREEAATVVEAPVAVVNESSAAP